MKHPPSAIYRILFVIVATIGATASGDESKPLPFGVSTGRWTAAGDLSAQMVAGIDRYLDRMTAESVANRTAYWKRDFSSPEAYAASVAPNRERLRTILGAVDAILPPVQMRYVSGPGFPALVAESDTMRVHEVRWTVFEGVYGEGLLLTPKGKVVARMVVLPDADQTPEMLAGLAPGLSGPAQVARRFAEAGCEVVVPALINRQSTWSGNPLVAMTDQTHREWIWRPAYEVGRHIIGFELRKVEAAVEWLLGREGPALPVGVAGHGEGGLIALCTAALDQRVKAALVSGHFQPRERLWSEPIYRSVWGLLREFGDAEIASLIAPRAAVIEYSAGPKVSGPPSGASTRKKCAAPGSLTPPSFDAVRQELERAKSLCTAPNGRIMGSIELLSSKDGTAGDFGSTDAGEHFIAALGVPDSGRMDGTDGAVSEFTLNRVPVDGERQSRQVGELIEHCQRLLRTSESTRTTYARRAAPTTPELWVEESRPLKDKLWRDVIGRLPDPSLPMHPRVRCIEEREAYSTWEVMLDVWPDVFASGYLLVPADLKPGERRPVVVCQHGLEGLPASVVEEDRNTRDWAAYRAYARQLAERGFICYCPHNPYRGGESFRQLQRKAHPLGLSLFSFILGQHQRQLEWLVSLPFVDAKRIGFYGLSYGGVTALRVPGLLDGYCVSICSAAFNDWPRKIMSLDFRAAYVFTAEYDHFSFNLANTFGNAELATLIAPRPFMVERGHQDGVAPDEWVAYEYAKVRRLYAALGMPERTEIEYFSGGHEIHGVGTFEFLERHLNWPLQARHRIP